MSRKLLNIFGIVVVTASLSACGAGNAVREVMMGPQLSPITNPTADPDYRPITVPMPAPYEPTHLANSLWRTGSTSFFDDQRANRV